MGTVFSNRTVKTPLDSYVSTSLAGAVSRISEETVFLDDAFSPLRDAVHSIEKILYPETTWFPFSGRDFVRASDYTELLSILSVISRISNVTVDLCFSRLQELSNFSIDSGEKISSVVSEIERISSAISMEIVRQSDSASVKDESIVYDIISGSEVKGNGSLLYDVKGGCIVLPPLSARTQPFTVKSVEFNYRRGSIAAAEYGASTDDVITKGVYLSRIFSMSPRFENDDDSDTTSINDGDLTTSFSAEYNTRITEDPLSVVLVLVPNGQLVSAVSIIANPGDTESVLSKSDSMPYIDFISITQTDGKVVDLTSTLLGDTVVVKETIVGTENLPFSYVPTNPYPGVTIYTQSINVSEITLRIKSGSPQIVEYPEMVFMSELGNIIGRLSYPETLIATGYVAPDNRKGPADWYSDSDIETIIDRANSSYRKSIMMNSIYRHSVEIADISLHTMTFSTSGTFETDNLFSAIGRSVASVEIFVSEVVPSGTTIRYFFNCGENQWNEIIPANQTGRTGVNRILCSPLDIRETDSVRSDLFYIKVKTVRLRIVMTGNGYSTPQLKSYAVRIKTEVDN